MLDIIPKKTDNDKTIGQLLLSLLLKPEVSNFLDGAKTKLTAYSMKTPGIKKAINKKKSKPIFIFIY
jgi:hypothetical protein